MPGFPRDIVHVLPWCSQSILSGHAKHIALHWSVWNKMDYFTANGHSSMRSAFDASSPNALISEFDKLQTFPSDSGRAKLSFPKILFVTAQESKVWVTQLLHQRLFFPRAKVMFSQSLRLSNILLFLAFMFIGWSSTLFSSPRKILNSGLGIESSLDMMFFYFLTLTSL